MFSIGEGEVIEAENRICTTVETMGKFIGQLDSAIEASSKDVLPEKMAAAEGTGIDIIAGFPEKIEGEILFLDA